MRTVFRDEQVDPEAPLWRYFKLHRIIDTLRSRTLYFPCARQFEDPFEGAVSVESDDEPRSLSAPPPAIEDDFEQLRRLTKISSWHRGEYESDAMWKLYAAGRKGVAIRTTAGCLDAGLHPFRLTPDTEEEEPYWGSVRYVDLSAERLRVNLEERFFYKHRAFEWEREFRIAISLRKAEERGTKVPDLGIRVPCDPCTLIETIYVGPSLAPEDRAALRQACEAADMAGHCRNSTLLGRPRYA